MKIEDNRFNKLKLFREINIGDLFAHNDCTFLKISEKDAFCFEALAVDDFEYFTTVEFLNAKIVIE